MRIKKLIASILAVMMLVGTFPMYAFAEDDGNQPDAGALKVNVYIYHVDEQGNDIARPDFYEKNTGEEFFAYYKKLNDYHAKNGSMGETVKVEKEPGETQNVFLYYVKNTSSKEVTIKYVDEWGDQLAEDKVVSVEEGSAFEYEAPAIEGYAPEQDIYKIDSVDEDQDLVITYLKQNFTVDIHFVKDDKEFSNKSYGVKRGETLTYECPQVEGYEVPFDSYTVTTDPIDMDREITVEYSKKQYLITVHYVDKNGKTVAPDAMEQVEYMDSIEIDNPVIEGYKTDADAISISNVDEDMEVSVVYTKIEKKDDNKKSDSPDTGDEDSLMLMLLMMMGAGAGLVAIRKREE